jgi:hypothetical protein
MSTASDEKEFTTKAEFREFREEMGREFRDEMGRFSRDVGRQISATNEKVAGFDKNF